VPARNDPALGAWYRNIDDDETFQVVVYDETDGVVEIQASDGEVRALELDEWREMDVEPIEDPDEWSLSTDEDDDEEEMGWRRRGSWREDEQSDEM